MVQDLASFLDVEPKQSVEPSSMAMPMKSKWAFVKQHVSRKRQTARKWSGLLLELKTMHRKDRRKAIHVSIPNLEEAFYAISAHYDMDGDGRLGHDEVICVFESCNLLDEKLLKKSALGNFVRSSAFGCNAVTGVDSSKDGTDDSVDYEEFSTLVEWVSRMGGMPYSRCKDRIIRLSRRMVDENSSAVNRLRIIFGECCRMNEAHMHVQEFIPLCTCLGLYEQGKFCVGDAFSVYYGMPDQTEDGIDFDGFLCAVDAIGQRLNLLSHEIREKVADCINKVMSNHQETFRIVKNKVKLACLSDIDSFQTFLATYLDDSGYMDFEEFLSMCRTALKLTERENHLRLLFEKLDADASGELSIDELTAFFQN
eukprot:TRINITY_DN34526_c0_g1_i1.p1 TRINITY_DN34526_c0_g1~~TRINITY_DN34526_c0_g1_i1.p1  ORF type:complete len:368 (+),score=45.12 TRINITY_DN34526_c0_g1_i1:408-1511(+)